jgi:hypothetical protein
MSLIVAHEGRTITVALTVAVVHATGPLANRIDVPLSVDPGSDLPLVAAHLRLHMPTTGAALAAAGWHEVPGGAVISFAAADASVLNVAGGHFEARWAGIQDSRVVVPFIVI